MAGYNVGDLTVTLSAQVNEFNRRMQSAASSFQGLTQSAQQAEQSVSSFERATKSAAVAAGAFVASGMFMAKQSFAVAASASELEVAMGAIEDSMGLAGGSINEAALAVRSKGIEMAEAQRIAISFAQANLDLAQASDVARAAQDLAVLSQSNSTETAMRLTYAIQTGNSRMLRSVGIQKYASEAYDEYAAQVGKTVEQLTQIERQQAITNMVLEEAANVAGVYSAAMTEPGKVLRSFPRLLNDMQLAFGEVLLDGFGPVIKAAYDLTKQLSLSVREGGAFASLLENLRGSFVVLLDPLTLFLNNLTEGVKTLNETGFSLSNLSAEFERIAPMIAGAGSALALFAGSNLLKMIPGLGQLAGMIGAKGPIALGLAVLVGTSPELRASFIKLAKAAEPLAVAAGRLAEAMGEVLIGALGNAIEITGALVVAITPVIEALASFAEFATRNEHAVQLLAAALTVLIAKQKLFGSETAAGTQVAASLSKSLGNLQLQFSLAKMAVRDAGTATTAFGVKAQAGFMMAKAAALSFIASVAPLVIITAAVYAIGKAFEYFNNRGKDVRERTEELVPVIQDLTDAFIENQGAAEGFASGMDVVMGALTAEGSEETDKFKDALLDLGVTAPELGEKMIALENDFDRTATAILRSSGLSRDLAADMLKVVNGTDDNGDALIDYANYLRRTNQITSEFTAEQEAMLKALEETQDQTENLDGPGIARDALLDLRRSGELTLEAFEFFNQQIEDGVPGLQVYADALDHISVAFTAGNNEADRYRNNLFLIGQEIEATTDAIGPLVNETYEADRAFRQVAKRANEFADEVANLDSDVAHINDVADDFIDELRKVDEQLTAVGKSSEEVRSTQLLMAQQFVESLGVAGYTEEAIQSLANQLLILDGIDPDVIVTMGLEGKFDLETINEQLDKLRGRLTDPFLRGSTGGVVEGLMEAIKQLEIFQEVAIAFDQSSSQRVRRGVQTIKDETKGLSETVEEANDELLTLNQRLNELVAVLLGPGFAQNESVVFLEEMRDAVHDLAQAMTELSEAQALQRFNEQVEASIGQIVALFESGAGADAINEFIQGLVGPDGALLQFAATAGISEQDFAQSFAAITAAANQALSDIAFFEAVEGMTPEEIEAMERFFAGLPEVEDPGPVATGITGAAVGGGTTNITINMPQGVTGEQVVEALTNYAQTEGATVPAAFQFVNT